MKTLFSTKEVAQFLDVNEKMVYALISEKGLPATKITGKWLFPRHLVEQWIESKTINYPKSRERLPPYHGLLILAGSNDLLLDRTIAVFNEMHTDQLVVFGNLGSTGGLRALKRNFCHMAACHLLQEDEEEYNFDYAMTELDEVPVAVNFCRREQGLLIGRDNPKNIRSVGDLGQEAIRIVNRHLGTGTRLLFDHELKKAGVNGEKIDGYRKELHRHMDVGLEILSGRADAGPGIRPIASLLGLDFIPIRWERYDLLITRDRFFDRGIQQFLGLLQEKPFTMLARSMAGYDTRTSGKMIFPKENGKEEPSR